MEAQTVILTLGRFRQDVESKLKASLDYRVSSELRGKPLARETKARKDDKKEEGSIFCRN